MNRILTIFSTVAETEGISISALEKSIGAEWILTGKGPMLRNQGTTDLHQLKEEGDTYQLYEQIALLKERIEILKTANEALKANNTSLMEIKQMLKKRIEDLEQ